MKILSIDVGIKNLAYCIINLDGSNISILDWNTISLCENDMICNYVTKKGVCKSKASLIYEDKLYCKTHAKKTDMIEYKKIPTQKKLKSEPEEELNKIINRYNLEINNKKSKNEKIKEIINKLKDKSLKDIKKKNAGKIELLELGIGIKREFNKLELHDIDLILIENQIGPLANRMKSIQSMLIQYFIMINKKNIECVSSCNKLKFLKEKYLSYKENKDLSKSIVKKYLDQNKQIEQVNNIFETNKKKDDLADAFLQGCAYLIEKKMLDNIFNNADDLK